MRFVGYFGLRFFALVYVTIMALLVRQHLKQVTEYSSAQLNINILDGCRHVYLDVGSNIGVQVRKLFQPQLYPKAQVLPLFNALFGEERNGMEVCAVGFEPNPNHVQALENIEKHYQKCGWRVKFFTNSAVSNVEGTGEFYTDDAKAYKEWGGGILVNSSTVKRKVGSVALIRLAKFIMEVVATRRISDSNGSLPPTVVMKMDIEGSEVEVIPDLVLSGALSHVDAMMIEWHDPTSKGDRKSRTLQARALIQTLSKLTIGLNMSHKLFFSMQDDEMYFRSMMPFPNC